MLASKPVVDIIRRRFSCRTYLEQPISLEKRKGLKTFIDSLKNGPFGSHPRFHLVSADNAGSQVLNDLGTFNYIHGAMGYIIGTLDPGEKNLEDYGYQMEEIILFATSLDLGTCWLGGTFTRGSFARKINSDDALIPAVTSIGEISDVNEARNGLLRRQISADKRLPPAQLFFDRNFSTPLRQEEAGKYATPLEMVRIGPSASNKQPWRVVKEGTSWHFYLRRSKGYHEEWLARIPGFADIQRVDMGIAICHFELAARKLGLSGVWLNAKPEIATPDDLTEYVVSWVRRSD